MMSRVEQWSGYGSAESRSIRIHLLDADEHAMPAAFVGEAGAVCAGSDRPALRVVGAVVDCHRGKIADVAQHPLHRPALGDAHSVGMFTVLQWGVGELRLAADALGVYSAARLT